MFLTEPNGILTSHELKTLWKMNEFILHRSQLFPQWSTLILFPKTFITGYLVKTDQLAELGGWPFFAADLAAVRS